MSTTTSSEILSAFSIIFLIAWWNDWPPIADYEVTTYRMMCHECKPEEMILYREVFKADPATHTVTSWSKEGDYISILHDCAIRNKSNWRCDTRKVDSSEPKLVDGIFSENTQSHLSEQIPWYRWWWLRVGAALR